MMLIVRETDQADLYIISAKTMTEHTPQIVQKSHHKKL